MDIAIRTLQSDSGRGAIDGRKPFAIYVFTAHDRRKSLTFGPVAC